MVKVKQWFQSRTIWMCVLLFLVNGWNAVATYMGYHKLPDVDAATAGTMLSSIGMVLAVLAGFFRKNADAKILPVK